MRLLVQYTAQLRTALEKAEEEIEIHDRSSVADLLVRMAANWHAEATRHVLTPAGVLQPSLLVVLNSEVVPAAEAGRVQVKPGDVVTLMPPIAGG
jgi:molybdopterin converting factor small subunit